MSIEPAPLGVSRRLMLAGFAATGFVRQAAADELDEAELLRKYVGFTATDSSRVHLQIPPVFSNGYRVPMTIVVDSLMTEADHVRAVHILAPLNPIIPVAVFRFTLGGGRAKLSTRIRIAQSQAVLAVAEMSDGAHLMSRAAVKVDIDGCK